MWLYVSLLLSQSFYLLVARQAGKDIPGCMSFVILGRTNSRQVWNHMHVSRTLSTVLTQFYILVFAPP